MPGMVTLLGRFQRSRGWFGQGCAWCWTLAAVEEGGNASTGAAPGSSGGAPMGLRDTWVSHKHGRVCVFGEMVDQTALWYFSLGLLENIQSLIGMFWSGSVNGVREEQCCVWKPSVFSDIPVPSA